MNDDAPEFPPYPPHIAALLDDARPLDEAPGRAKADVRARVLATVGAAAVVTAAANTAQSTTATAATVVAKPAAGWFGAKGALLALGIGAAGLLLALLLAPKNDGNANTSNNTHNQAISQVPAAAASDAGVGSSANALVASDDAAASIAVDAQAPTAAVESHQEAGVEARPTVARDTLVEEQRLLDRARAALASGDHDEALAVLSRHGRRFARGQLAMERDALEVRALTAAGRAEDARAAAARFASRWPSSPLRSAVEAMIR